MDIVIVDTCEHIGEPGLRINVVELGRLCRMANYAERFWGKQWFGCLFSLLHEHCPVPFGIVWLLISFQEKPNVDWTQLSNCLFFEY